MEEISKVIKSRVHHGFNISIARNRKGLKQAALADMLGISQQRLSQLENQRVVKDEILEKVSEATGVSIEDLKTIEEPMSVYIENNNNTISDPANDKIYIGNNIEQDNSSFTNNTNPLDKIVELYERLLKEEKERVKTLEKRIKELEGKA
jgi:transcriptional regulator with XRE-family HTH domain